MKLITSITLSLLALSQVTTGYIVNDLKEELEEKESSTYQIRSELMYEINRVQDRADRQDGELTEKLNMIEAILSKGL